MSDKQKHIININRKKLSSKQIKEKEKFDSIIKKHEKITKRPAYKQKRFYFILFIILFLAYLVYQSEKEKKEKVKTEQTN
jgi:hypothetical protein